ncbi:hypothetical protein SARC_05964 [Sphaeroforma arctica JP610]|uniref:Uncharacterized protein n=1 Tax=Sphaeroforma arctica JP610 TaxID=667725 RepID=A0A0L0G0I4_9EUKA|nr:hypothetical protein SARC_05964 [Sphaeroforma arctica JP610]KNC81723.1 hypothetical protein SARC_05964 [Sphaeroforma arctica JP610]|eukprot:XP_014155625.1 hypothetical protein SARC_05964 [Sphaeroforma arctica JP610]
MMGPKTRPLPTDLDQATLDEDFSETQAGPTVQQRWAPQYPTLAGSTPTRQLPDKGANGMKKISPVKRRIERTRPVPQVAPYGELQDNSQDPGNVPIDTITYPKQLSVHHDRYLEDPQAVKRHKGSEPTEPSITASTAAEMKL